MSRDGEAPISVTPEALFRYADRFARRSESKGNGTQNPTMRQTAKRFRCRYDDIESACDCYQGPGYLGIAVGFAIQGVGTASFDSRGECQVEAYE